MMTTAMRIESCPMDNMNILMLLGQYEKYREGRLLNRAIAHCWALAAKDVRHGFGIGRRFMSLQYPAVKYGILRVLDVLSLFPYAVEKRGFQDMLDFVHQKARAGSIMPNLLMLLMPALISARRKSPADGSLF